MAGIALTINAAQITKLTTELAEIRNGVPKAITSAVNKTLTTGRSMVVKRLAAEINLKQKEIRDTIGIKKATYDTLQGVITISRKGISLMKFAPKPSAPVLNRTALMKLKGVSVKTRRGKGRELLAHTFVARMKSGHVGVFERKGRGTNRTKRLPLHERFGPTPQGVFEKAPGITTDVMSGLTDTLAKNLDSQIDRLLLRKKPTA